MSEKIYLHLLVLCGILCQGIIATLSDENARESSDFLVRKRRVISHLPGGSNRTNIRDVNYVVTIREMNRAKCGGVILSHHTVITSAPCVKLHESQYKVLAGSENKDRSKFHNVISKIENYGNLPHQYFDGIALVTVDPPFIYSAKVEPINLYVGPLTEGLVVSVSGWGCKYPRQPGPPGLQRGLRSIIVPIMNHEMCKNIYRHNYQQLGIQHPINITDKNICTYDQHQYCAHNDAGAPLVVLDMLAGIHSWKGDFTIGINPDVFIDLRRVEYSQWIRQNIH